MGVPSNLYSLYHAAVQLRQRNELGVYLLNLTVSDLLYQASLPLWLQYIFRVTGSAEEKTSEGLIKFYDSLVVFVCLLSE